MYHHHDAIIELLRSVKSAVDKQKRNQPTLGEHNGKNELGQSKGKDAQR